MNAFIGWLLVGCRTPECAHGDYYAAECRVAAENHYARLLTSTGVELRFHEPTNTITETWDALGLFDEVATGVVEARPAGLADFAISIDPGVTLLGATSLTLTLVNVAPETTLAVGPLESLVEVPSSGEPGLTRVIEVPLASEVVWAVGTRPCPERYRIVAAGDVQTNPIQFERIVEDLHREAMEAEAAGEPLLGMLLLGDLSEDSLDAEFENIRNILVTSPIPVATTPGNHDIFADDVALYNRWFGPGNYSFDVCDTKVTLLDTSNGELARSVEGRLPELVGRTERQFLIAGTHYPPYPGRTGAGWADGDQAWYLLSELSRNEADVFLAGHVHGWMDFPDLPIGDGTVDEIITGTAGGSQGLGQPHFGYTRLTFGASLDTCFVEVPELGRLPDESNVGGDDIRRCE